ncbi:hypothetical protein BDV25DRAFT_47501 [Aspergillus avenaceus]|uniref:Uncharacterized protein n=1 Tax=Aspergillus avenaceus TaxID=36643 RepID=A0A5N6TJT4_ASPAV|nr:hypothetical protein BDV25DRAFT_47501 [Aspergillus avenaceus]
MPQPRIKQFFKRPAFAATNEDVPAEAPGATADTNPRSSPVTESSPTCVSKEASPPTPDGAALQLKQSLLNSVEVTSEASQSQENSHNDDAIASDPPLPSSFLSQRIVKNGKEVVISSDGEESDTGDILENPDSLFLSFVQPTDTSANEEADNSARTLRPRSSKEDVKPSKSSSSRASARTYKHTMDSLVTQAIDDNETENTIAKIRASFDEQKSRKEDFSGSDGNNRQLHEGILTSAFDEDHDETGLRRLLDAVRRTEAFDIEKSWFFLEHGKDMAPPPAFPRGCINSKSYISVLRDPQSRERAFYSGAVDYAMSRNALPDDLIMWILNSVPSEPREGLRYVYTRALKNSGRLGKLVRPSEIDALFQRMGATPKALAVTEVTVPDTLPKNSSSQKPPQHQAATLSILDLLHGAADFFSEDTKEHILNILFRMSLDISLASNPNICSELERTITATLESIPEEDTAYRVCITAYKTIKDPVFQARLLQHILPTSSWIAMLRCRLAVSFLTNDSSPLKEELDMMDYLEKTITVLGDKRFNVKRYKQKDQPEFDYGELIAITTLLNIVIDSGWSGVDFSSKDIKQKFNSRIDVLSDRIRKIFTSIEDSGASHLKRTLAKEALEALHYRIVYSVRTKPPTKKSIFGKRAPEREHNTRVFDRHKKIPGTEDGPEIPIRQHEVSS